MVVKGIVHGAPLRPPRRISASDPLFFVSALSYTRIMSILSGLGTLGSRLFNDNKGPWGPKADVGGGERGDADPPSGPIPGPWGNERPTPRGRDTNFGAAGLDAFIERNRRRFGGALTAAGAAPVSVA